MDWLSAGTTSNNNQSNSYTLRQRQIWGQAALDSGWKFTGGQMWSLTTETTKLLDNGTEILPSSIDPQYMTGFVWNRQYGFRMSKDVGNKFAIGMSAENDQMLVGGSSLPTNELHRRQRNRRRPLQQSGHLLLQPRAGTRSQNGLPAGLGTLGTLRRRPLLP